MTDSVTNVEIEDVLSSIRRLVSQDARVQARQTGAEAADKLVLTPALRVADAAVAEVEAAEAARLAETSAEPIVLTEAMTPDTTPEHTSAQAAHDAAAASDPDDGAFVLSQMVEQEVARALGAAPDDVAAADETTSLEDMSDDDVSDWSSLDDAVTEPPVETHQPEAAVEEIVTESFEPAEPQMPEATVLHLVDAAAEQSVSEAEHVAEAPPVSQAEDASLFVAPKADGAGPEDVAEVTQPEQPSPTQTLREVWAAEEPEHSTAAYEPQDDEVDNRVEVAQDIAERDMTPEQAEDSPEEIENQSHLNEVAAFVPEELAQEMPSGTADVADHIPEAEPEQTERRLFQSVMPEAAGPEDPAWHDAIASDEPVPAHEDLTALISDETPEQDDTLESKITRLEALVGQADQDDDYDADHAPENANAAFRHNPVEALDWEDHTTEPVEDHKTETVVEDVEPVTAQAAPAAAAAAIAAQDFDADDALVQEDAPVIDEEILRDMVGEIVRQELQGALGERITRNVRKLVRREIHRVLTTQDMD